MTELEVLAEVVGRVGGSTELKTATNQLPRAASDHEIN
jgi:hypothetical protein